MKIWINTLSGDVKIISALNHYIGMKHIEVSMFPEFKYMIYIVGFLVGFGLLTALVNKRYILWMYSILILSAGIGALVDFYLWGYNYGHNLDPTAPIVMPGMSYQPPLIGTKQLLNFTAFSGPDIGGWIFMSAGLLVIGVLCYEIYVSRKKIMKMITLILMAGFVLSCSSEQELLRYGKDACYTCKMTLMDKKFGAEIITAKGKVYKFDDANCMVNFINSDYLAEETITRKLIVDYSQPEKLIPAEEAFYLKSDQIRSPMVSQIAAFETEQVMLKYKPKLKAIYLSWGELMTQFK